jgi:asparagine synthase (glutamine-hydrolysing)
LRASGLPRLDAYLSFSSYYAQQELSRLLGPAIVERDYDPFALHRSYLTRADGADELSRILYLDAKTFLPALNLTYTDKLAMAASVEVRVPLLDDDLVALAARIPSSFKLKGWRRKYIFKRSQEGVLPREVIWRRKAGFSAPLRAWLRGDLAPLLSELLSHESLERRGLVDPGYVSRLISENDSGRADNGFRLYALLSLELWCRTFLDRTWDFDSLVERSGSAAATASRAASV